MVPRTPSDGCHAQWGKVSSLAPNLTVRFTFYFARYPHGKLEPPILAVTDGKGQAEQVPDPEPDSKDSGFDPLTH